MRSGVREAGRSGGLKEAFGDWGQTRKTYKLKIHGQDFLLQYLPVHISQIFYKPDGNTLFTAFFPFQLRRCQYFQKTLYVNLSTKKCTRTLHYADDGGLGDGGTGGLGMTSNKSLTATQK